MFHLNDAFDRPSHGVAMSSMTLGKESKQTKATYLQKRGYRVSHRNCHIVRGEIDLVADHMGVLLFIEVKAYRGARFGLSAQAVDFRKQQRLIHVPRHFLHRYQCEDRQCRFNVILLTQKVSGNVQIELFQNAFEL